MAADTRPPTGTPAAVPEQVAPAIEPVATAGTPDAGDAFTRPAVLCPYLRMADGSHRALAASRDHRCWAVDPPGAIPPQVQNELCLGATHTACERYVAVRGHRAAGLAADHIPARLVAAPRFAIPVDPVPVAVDARAAGRDAGPIAATVSRRRLPALLIAAGVMLVSVVVLAAFLGGGILGTGPGASPTPALAALAASMEPTAAPTPRPTRTPATTRRPTAAPSVAPASDDVVVPQLSGEPTPRPDRTPIPSFEVRRRYLVKEGDTWRSIAERFGLRPKDLRAVNGPLVVGEKLVIPAGPVVPDGG